MIGLGLRLTLNGGKEAAARLAITTAAVALGVGMLLMALAGMNAINAQNARTAWLNTTSLPGLAAPGLNTSTADPLWWLVSTDHFGTQTIDRVDVAATGPSSPLPPSSSPRCRVQCRSGASTPTPASEGPLGAFPPTNSRPSSPLACSPCCCLC